MLKIALVAAGGAAGSVARYLKQVTGYSSGVRAYFPGVLSP